MIAPEEHVADRLATEPVLWLTTVSAEGRPHSVPVWFHWQDPDVLVFSRPGTVKLAHLPGPVAVSLDTADHGQDVVLGEGTAVLPAEYDDSGFALKYGSLIPGTYDGWRTTFSQPVLITLTKLIAWRRTGAGLHYTSLPQ